MINKADLNTKVTEEIEDYLKEENIAHISNLPYDESFTKAMVEGKTIVEFDKDKSGVLKPILVDSWEKIKIETNKEK